MRFPGWLRAISRRDSELDEEVEAHLRMAVRDRIERGEDPKAAELNARREFGNVAMVKDVARDLRSFASLERFMAQTRYAVRMLANSPVFTIAAALTLAVGLAAAAVIFGVVDTVLLRRLPFPGSDRIYTVSETIPILGQKPQVVTLDEYLKWRDSGVFRFCTAVDTAEFTLHGNGLAERIDGVQVTAEFFRILGVQPALGRDFRKGEDVPGASPVVILSHQLWARRFHSDPRIIGQSVRFGDTLRNVIGVMPPMFSFPRHADLSGLMGWLPEQTEFWVPFQFTQKDLEQGNFNYLVLGRLADGVTREQARQRLLALTQVFWKKSAKDHPEYADLILRTLPSIQVHPDPLRTTMTSGVKPALWILFGAVALLLVLIYANLANLFLTRSAVRRREIAIRLALGASRWHILYERLVESAVFALLACGIGLLLAMWGTALVRTLGANHLPRLHELAVDYRLVLFLSLLGALAAVLFGVIPQFGASLGERNRTTTAGRGEQRLRACLVTAEVALSMVLMLGAALLLESFRQVLHANPGFDSSNVLTASLGLPLTKSQNDQQRYQQYQRFLGAVRRIPSVDAASITNAVPLRGEAEIRTLRIVRNGQQIAAPQAEYRMVDPDFLRVLHIPLIRGRWFEEKDRGPVTVISDNMARKYWPSENPVGRQFYENERLLTIIGVVGAVRNGTLEREPMAQFYTPAAAHVYSGMWVVIRTRVAPEDVTADLRRAISSVDPEQPVAHIRTMKELVDATTMPRRFETWLLSSFAAIALFLAALGVFAVLSLSVTRRTREFGIRIALGATAESVLRLVMAEAARLLAAGVGIGIALAFVSARVLRSLLYGVTASDPRVFAATLSVLVAAGLLACWIPAHRASRSDPALVLREE